MEDARAIRSAMRWQVVYHTIFFTHLYLHET